MKTILLLPALSFPIPAVKGGAVEQLITYLLEVNERFGDVRFIVLSKYDEDAIQYSYKNSKVPVIIKKTIINMTIRLILSPIGFIPVSIALL